MEGAILETISLTGDERRLDDDIIHQLALIFDLKEMVSDIASSYRDAHYADVEKAP